MCARILLLLLAASVPFVDVLFAVPQPPAGGKKYALLVGVNKYDNRQLKDRPLKYAERDVIELAKVLRANGFEVRVLLGAAEGADRATRENIEKAVAELLKKVKGVDTLLTAFAGHGEQFQPAGQKEEQPFFLPVDAVPMDPTTQYPFNDLLKKLDERGAGTNLVLVDACRTIKDPNRGTRSGIDGSKAVALREGTVVFFACSRDQEARETEKAGGGHGVFFHHVIDGLKGGARNEFGEVTWEGLVAHVKDRTKRAYPEWFPGLPDDKRQRPQSIGNLSDAVVLASGLAKASRERERPEEPPPGDLAKKDRLPGETVEKFEYVVDDTEKKQGTRRVLTVDIGGGEKMELVRIEPGEFLMGAPDGEKDAETDEKPQRKVKITKAFYLGKYEVTQAQYKAVMGSNPSHFTGNRLPVEKVSWDDAVAYCEALGKKLGRKVMLPSEAQWEYACRAGTTTPFHFGSKLNGDKANHNGDYPYGTDVKGQDHGKTVDVGSYAPNGFGLYDMHGNVWEWCQDYYGQYDKLPSTTNPLQLTKQS